MTKSHLPVGADGDKIDRLATTLIEARTSGRALGKLPDELIPTDATEAQLVDDHVAHISGWRVLGWKIGCTSEAARKMLDSPGPFAGRIYSIFESGVTLGDADLIAEPHLEGEFAFTLATDIEPTAGKRSRSDALEAIADARPAIELVGGRFTDFFGTPLPALIADAGANTHLILGSPAGDVDLDSLSAVTATMTVDGRVTGLGSGADVLGDPINALMWLLEHLAARNIGLRSGDAITTGTATQVSALPIGSTATATLGNLGSVSLSRA